MSDGSQDKQLPASQKKLDNARKEGQVVRSKDLGHFLVLLGATAALLGLTPMWMSHMEKLLVAGLQFDARTVARPEFMLERAGVWVTQWLMVAVPFGLAVMLGSVVASVAAGGWVMSFQIIAPKFGKLNPIAGIANLFSKAHLLDALKASAMGLLLGAAGVHVLIKEWPSMAELLAMPLPTAIHAVGTSLAEVIVSMLTVVAIFAIVDFPLQKYLFAENMKMSHQDQKEEFKQAEGNQEVKGRIKQKMREMARKRMLAAVPKADLVVMNPTHYAVALKYDEGSMGAPRVIAKGMDLLALKIRDIATENRVPVLEAPPLARALYAHTELDMEVPMALYSAVAQVLAYVYQLKQALTGQGAMPGNLPDLDVPNELDPHHPASATAKVRRAAMPDE
jgi:flagellar biosynthetic protein FlhB